MTVRILRWTWKNLETKHWGVIGEWVQLRQNTGDVGEADDQGKSDWGKKKWQN